MSKNAIGKSKIWSKSYSKQSRGKRKSEPKQLKNFKNTTKLKGNLKWSTETSLPASKDKSKTLNVSSERKDKNERPPFLPHMILAIF
jgi:hypothetical protein